MQNEMALVNVRWFIYHTMQQVIDKDEELREFKIVLMSFLARQITMCMDASKDWYRPHLLALGGLAQHARQRLARCPRAP